MDKLIKLIDEYEDTTSLLYGDYDSYFKDYKLELVEQKGGEEQGSHIYAVYKVNDDKLLMVYGFYQSFYEVEYEGCKIVTAKTKMVTYYA